MSDPTAPTTPLHDARDRRVCWACVCEDFLSGQIQKNGVRGKCFYCSREGNTFSVSEIAAVVKAILENHFHQEYSEPEEIPKGTLIADVIYDRLELFNAELAEDIRRTLSNMHASDYPYDMEQNPFVLTARYAKDETIRAVDFEYDWIRLEESIKTEARFFNRHAEDFLSRIFDGIDSYTTSNGYSIIVKAGPETDFPRFHRARTFQSVGKFAEALKRPDRELGPPPASQSKAGRMHSVGIPAFYGATTSQIALAEVRPPVGSKVLIACFEVTRPLRLLNLAALDHIADPNGSLFDEYHRSQLNRAAFLRGLSARLSKPVMPDDEPLEYLPTQVIAEFVATRDQEPLPLDGILFPSVQVGLPPVFPRPRRRIIQGGPKPWECNVVLFRNSARVQLLDEDAEYAISDSSWAIGILSGLQGLDFSAGVDYFVKVKTKEQSPNRTQSQDDAPLRFSSMEVQDVESVRFQTKHGSVHRCSE